jgi:hypothetical protein
MSGDLAGMFLRAVAGLPKLTIWLKKRAVEGEMLDGVSKNDAELKSINLETAYPAAEDTLLGFLTGEKQGLEDALKYIKKSQWNSYLKGSTLVANGKAIVSAAHHLQVPDEVKNLVIVESHSVVELVNFAQRLPQQDIFELHIRKAGRTGGWIYAKVSGAALDAAKSAPPDIKTTFINQLSPHLEPFF